MKQNFPRNKFTNSNDHSGKKSGKDYYEYMAESKKKQEMLIKQKLEECKNASLNVNKPIKYEHTVKSECTSKELQMKESHKINMKTEKLIKKPLKSFDEISEVQVPEDSKCIIAIENLVSQVSLLPEEMHEGYLKNFEDQEDFWFLTLHECAEFKYFQWRLKDTRRQYMKGETKSEIKQESMKWESDNNSRKRKSRWGDDKTNVLSNVVTGPMLTETQKDQIQYQKELQAMHEFIQAQQKAKEQELMSSIEGVKYKPHNLEHKYEYDSDEDIDGGTWEHKLRESEMTATKDWASKLTEMGQGKHHIGDFLPPDEFMKFMETYRALKEGRKPEYGDYQKFKLTCENVGYKMLQKMGWKEGEGLGTESQGITVPISSGAVKPTTSGIGIEKISNLTKNDDEYEAYRKRMMLAYRFRPNPLNNPRRDYY